MGRTWKSMNEGSQTFWILKDKTLEPFSYKCALFFKTKEE